jgi:hypothetical protein
MRGPCTATLVFGRISPEVTLTSVPPRTTSVAGRSPLAVAASSRVISFKGVLKKPDISTLLSLAGSLLQQRTEHNLASSL